MAFGVSLPSRLPGSSRPALIIGQYQLSRGTGREDLGGPMRFPGFTPCLCTVSVRPEAAPVGLGILPGSLKSQGAVATSVSAPRQSPQKKKGNYGFSGARLLPELLPTSWSMSLQFPAQCSQLRLRRARSAASLREEDQKLPGESFRVINWGRKKTLHDLC